MSPVVLFAAGLISVWRAYADVARITASRRRGQLGFGLDRTSPLSVGGFA